MHHLKFDMIKLKNEVMSGHSNYAITSFIYNEMIKCISFHVYVKYNRGLLN